MINKYNINIKGNRYKLYKILLKNKKIKRNN